MKDMSKQLYKLAIELGTAMDNLCDNATERDGIKIKNIAEANANILRALLATNKRVQLRGRAGGFQPSGRDFEILYPLQKLGYLCRKDQDKS